MSEIKPPVKPRRPRLEDVQSQPDQGHTWKTDEDGSIDTFAYEAGDYHNGPSCKDCGFGFCEHERDAQSNWDDRDCLRNQADSRNWKREADYGARLRKYEAQMEYYQTLIKGGDGE